MSDETSKLDSPHKAAARSRPSGIARHMRGLRSDLFAGSLGGVLPGFDSSTKTLGDVMLADQKRRGAMFKSLSLDAAAGFGGALSQGGSSTKTLRDVMRGLDDIEGPWADALLADQERRSSMLKSLGLGDSVKAMTAAGSLGGVLPGFGSSTKTLGDVMLADQKRRGAMFKSLSLDAAAGFGGALSQGGSSTKTLRDVMRGLDDIEGPWADALLADQERRSSMLKSLGLGDSVKAMTAAGSLGHALLADQERRSSMLKSLGLGDSVKAMTAAGSLGGVLPEFGSSTKTLRDVMRGLDDIKGPSADALLIDHEQGSSMLKSLGLYAADRQLAAVDGGWQETEEGLWVPDTAQLVAVTVTAYIALTVLGLYLQEMNRLGEGAEDLNRVELLFTVLGWLGLQWTGHQWIVKQLRRLDPPES